jgi:predicted transcriptional regulator
LESVGWPRAGFARDAKVLNCSSFDAEVASVAADIWLLLDEGLEDSEKLADQVYSDRYTFLLALKALLDAGFIKRDMKSTGSFSRLSDLKNSEE